MLCKIRFYVSQVLLKILYNSLIYPYLHYGNIVWANNYPTRLMKLFKLQKKALRIITFSPYTVPSLPLFIKMGLLIGSFSFSLISKSLPTYFSDLCIENTQVHGYNTRNSKHLHKCFNRTNYGKYSLRIKIVDTWNKTPLEIKRSLSIHVFKKKMKQFLEITVTCAIFVVSTSGPLL